MDENSPERQSLLDDFSKWVDSVSTIILRPDWSVDVPLWPQSDEVERLVPEPLLAKLTAWQLIFDSNYRWSEEDRPEGWLSEQAKDQWEQEAPLIVAELLTALDGKAELIVDLWPMMFPSQNRELQDYSLKRKQESERWTSLLKEAGITVSWRALTPEDGSEWSTSDEGENGSD
jgi:hypothetical protein